MLCLVETLMLDEGAAALVAAAVLPLPAVLPDDELELLLPHAATSRQPVISKTAPLILLKTPPTG
jgi:hypothetical protein